MGTWGNEQQQYMMQNMIGMNPMVRNMMPPGNMLPMMPPMYGPPPVPYAMPPPSNDGNIIAGEKNKDEIRNPRIENKNTKQRDKRTNQQDNNSNDKVINRKKSKWDPVDNWPKQPENPLPAPGVFGPGPMIPGSMTPYSPTQIMPPHMDMPVMPNMPGVMPNMPGVMPNMPGVMPNVPNPNIPNMGNMPPMPNMIPGMYMNQAILGNNQPIYVGNAALLPPLPNTLLPGRSAKPPDCKTIFVGGFPSNVTKEIVNEMFARFGIICDIKLNNQGVALVRFENTNTVEQAFFFSGSRFRYMDQLDSEATTIYIDYAPNTEDQSEHSNVKQQPPVQFEPCTPSALNTVNEKIKNEKEFSDGASTLEGWLQRGECNKMNANTFYNLIQSSNNHLRILYNEKMRLDEEFNSMKSTMKEKIAPLIKQFELVAKILTAASSQRVLDCFSRQQRKNVETWLKMTQGLTQIREEFGLLFDDEDPENASKKTISLEKFEELKKENEKLHREIEVFKKEANQVKDEAEKKFERYKAQYLIQNIESQMAGQVYPPLPPVSKVEVPKPDPPSSEEVPVSNSEAKIISAITAYLIIHPNGTTVDNIITYIKLMCPFVTQGTVNHILQKYSDVFMRKKCGKGVNNEFRWCFAMFERARVEGK